MENKVRDKEVLVSFPAGSVTLKPGSMFYEAQEKMAEFLKKTDDDQMLYNFRAQPDWIQRRPAMTGWDAPECNLKGHTTGHYLSALALSYSASGDEVLKKKMDYMVSGLFHCQKALEEKDGIKVSSAHTGRSSSTFWRNTPHIPPSGRRTILWIRSCRVCTTAVPLEKIIRRWSFCSVWGTGCTKGFLF